MLEVRNSHIYVTTDSWKVVKQVKLSLCTSWRHIGGVGVELHSFLTSLAGGDWSASRPGCLTVGTRMGAGWAPQPLWDSEGAHRKLRCYMATDGAARPPCHARSLATHCTTAGRFTAPRRCRQSGYFKAFTDSDVSLSVCLSHSAPCTSLHVSSRAWSI